MSSKKVILIGGFAASPTLQDYLERRLEQFRNLDGRKIKLITLAERYEHPV